MEPDASALREIVTTLERIERPSASAGEREAAEWIRDRFEGLGLRARVESEPAHGTYWWPEGIASAAGVAAGLLGRRHRVLGGLLGAAAAASIADDVSGGPHVLRRALPRRETYNVTAEAGDPDGDRTVVFVAHHDAAHGGFIFTPELITAVADRFPDWFEGQNTSPPIMQLVAAGPALAALGSVTGVGALRRAGAFVSAACVAAFADIAARSVVPGANDNLTAVATVLELGRILAADPPEGVRVLLVSTGAEESFMEGMRGWGARHFPSLSTASTRVVAVETVGSPELIVIEGEGMIRMTDYPAESRAFLAAAADEAGHPLRRGLRLGLATDGLIALRAGYPTSVLASVTPYKFPANYHSHKDHSGNVEWDSVAGAVRVCESVVRKTAALV